MIKKPEQQRNSRLKSAFGYIPRTADDWKVVGALLLMIVLALILLSVTFVEPLLRLGALIKYLLS